MMDALQKIIEREATEGIESLSWLEVTIHGAYWRKRHEPAHPGLVEAAAELTQLQAIATAAREVVKTWEARKYLKAIEMKPEMDKLAAALAALEQETE